MPKKQRTKDVSFQVTATDKNKKSRVKDLTITLIKMLRPDCIKSCKQLRALYAAVFARAWWSAGTRATISRVTPEEPGATKTPTTKNKSPIYVVCPF